MESIEVVPKALNGAGQLGWWDLAVKAAVPPGVCVASIRRTVFVAKINLRDELSSTYDLRPQRVIGRTCASRFPLSAPVPWTTTD
jgi:hypothetical protein